MGYESSHSVQLKQRYELGLSILRPSTTCWPVGRPREHEHRIVAQSFDELPRNGLGGGVGLNRIPVSQVATVRPPGEVQSDVDKIDEVFFRQPLPAESAVVSWVVESKHDSGIDPNETRTQSGREATNNPHPR
jgi:hypothetical protein